MDNITKKMSDLSNFHTSARYAVTKQVATLFKTPKVSSEYGLYNTMFEKIEVHDDSVVARRIHAMDVISKHSGRHDKNHDDDDDYVQGICEDLKKFEKLVQRKLTKLMGDVSDFYKTKVMVREINHAIARIKHVIRHNTIALKMLHDAVKQDKLVKQFDLMLTKTRRKRTHRYNTRSRVIK